MEEFLISDWSSPFGKFTELRTVLSGLRNATPDRKNRCTYLFPRRIGVNARQLRHTFTSGIPKLIETLPPLHYY